MNMVVKKMFVMGCLILFSLADAPGFAASPGASNSNLETYQPEALEDIDGFGFHRYVTKDRFGREISFYLSKTRSDKKLPLAICIQGSGCQSLFVEVDTPAGKRIGSGGTETVALRGFREGMRVLVVEKPGVTFLKQPSRPGGSREASDYFNQEFTMDRWVEAIRAAMEATLRLNVVDGEKILAMGHSEGGQVACELASLSPKVTHVACMAGGGPTQLFDLMQQARQGDMYDPNRSPDERVADLLKDWSKVQANPMASDEFILGHTHRRWTTFLRSSPLEAIQKSKAEVFIATGTEDTQSLPASSELLYCELLAKGRTCTFERVVGGDHAFMTKDDTTGKGWFETNEKAFRWFLDDAAK